MDNKEIKLTESYLDEAITLASKSLVGKLLKRFEIIEDKNIIKAEARELIYENYRYLRDILLAFDKGRDITIFDFKTKNNKSGA